jgi:hypothetical protein
MSVEASYTRRHVVTLRDDAFLWLSFVWSAAIQFSLFNGVAPGFSHRFTMVAKKAVNSRMPDSGLSVCQRNIAETSQCL